MEETEFSFKVIYDEKIILDLVNELFEDVELILEKLKDLKRDLYGSLSLRHKGIPIEIFKFLKTDFIDSVEKKPNIILNKILYLIFNLESKIINIFDFPIGISILGVFEKK